MIMKDSLKPGLTVNVEVKLEEVDGRRRFFLVAADDGVDTISKGTHERFIIDAAKFNQKVAEKANKAAAS
jgi:fluoroacetyl-CoA thioesterase